MEAPVMEHTEKEIIEMKSDIKALQNEVTNLKITISTHDQQISTLISNQAEIHENTKWLRRTITGAIIATLSTGIIGGSIAIIFNVFSK
jgi:chromosome segregation ATPase